VIIGVTGDTHNNLKNIKTICSIFNENATDLVLHTGDISLAKSLLAFKHLNCPLIAVLGNNDIEERTSLEEAATNFDCKIFEEPYFMNINKKKFAVMHHPELISEEITKTTDFIVHGHTHRYRLEKVGNCMIFNPGECAGMMKGKNKIGIVNLDNLEPVVISF
tara:strand:+ start:28 stop:516 length:489 start_codon:yes stop_codon:yes gene_type:complete